MKEEIVQMDESPQAVTGLGLMAVMQQAENLQAQGQLREAIDLYALWLKDSKESTRYVVYFNMASLLQSMGDMVGAELAYQSAIDLNPSFGQAYINLGLLYERQGLKQKALLQWNSFASQRFLFAT
ncbi:MAG: Photosystem assembly protein Ycf3, partial [Pseudomonadota bacterium]